MFGKVLNWRAAQVCLLVYFRSVLNLFGLFYESCAEKRVQIYSERILVRIDGNKIRSKYPGLFPYESSASR